MRYIFARHGESTANRDSIIANANDDHHLTETGIHQAEALADRLLQEGITKVFSSTLIRARETSSIISQRLGVPIIYEDALREFTCGTLEGRSDPEAWAEFIELFQDWLKGKNVDKGMGGGESVRDISNRFLPFITQLIMNHRGQEGAILLISHGGVLYTMLPAILENIDLEFASNRIITNTCIIVTEEHNGLLHCLEWCGESLA